MQIKQFSGAHGTTATRAKSIEAQQEFVSGDSLGEKPGLGKRAGIGVYFWAYHPPHYELAAELAKRWWNFAKTKGWYDKDPDKGCAVLYASLSVNAEEFLDFCHDVLLNRLYVTAQKRGIEKPDEFGALYDLLVAEVEQMTRCTIKVISARVPSPHSIGYNAVDVVHPLFGHSHCYVVRADAKSVISLQKAPN